MNTATRHRLLLMTLCALGSWNVTSAQTAPSTILEIDTANRVQYTEDLSDPSKFATDRSVTTVNQPKNFGQVIAIGDIVSVNGQPAKGTLIQSARGIALRTAPNPGQAIADTMRDAVADMKFEILTSDGSPIGTIMASGLAVDSPPPGAPLEVTQANIMIVGGTGAFLGARGQVGQAVSSQTIPVRHPLLRILPTGAPTEEGQVGLFSM